MKHISSFENHVDKKQIQKDILCPLLLDKYIRGIFVFLFIANEPIDKYQDLEMFWLSDCFSKSNMNDYSQKHTNCHFGWRQKLWVQLKSTNERMASKKKILSRKKKNDPRKKILLEKVKLAANN